MQGHPEAPRLWSKHIHNILVDMGFKSTTHEPCLYYGFHEGQEVLFLRQVDDFAVAAEDDSTNLKIIKSIDDEMKIKILVLLCQYWRSKIYERCEELSLPNNYSL